jgi:hypothetical protein
MPTFVDLGNLLTVLKSCQGISSPSIVSFEARLTKIRQHLKMPPADLKTTPILCSLFAFPECYERGAKIYQRPQLVCMTFIFQNKLIKPP